jgi:hypothetical protein
MSQKKPLPEGLMAQLHGKGSMSEVLRIERQRLMEQASEEMRLQLSGPASAAAPAPVAVMPKPAPNLEAGHARLEAAAAAAAPQPDTYQPSKLPTPMRRSQEGLSKLSRFVGEDLSEFDGIITHSEQTISAAPEWPTDPYYVDVHNTLPFSSQRDLLAAICRLTVGWGSFSCRITLSLLSAASGIRNAKTLRKWLADLQRKRHIRYVPVHGDLRGSIIELAPPEEVRSSIERGWRTNRMKF